MAASPQAMNSRMIPDGIMKEPMMMRYDRRAGPPGQAPIALAMALAISIVPTAEGSLRSALRS